MPTSLNNPWIKSLISLIRLKSRYFIARFCVAAAVATIAMGAAPSAAPPVEHWQIVLVAGDTAQPVFDNAVKAIDLWLVQHGVAAANIHRLAASADGHDPSIEPATLDRVLGRIADLHARPSEGCFVFITSHGAHNLGIYLSRKDEMLRPSALARALASGCGAVPTVVIVSGCYSGAFARGAMTAPNRIVLTAARADRASFGCSAEQTYTHYDSCLLAALPHATTWLAVSAETKDCVRYRESQYGETPSHPQASFGAAVKTLPLRF
jgi:peptidase C13-like protein